MESEGAAVGDSHSTSSRIFRRLSTLKMELDTQQHYANLVSEMMTFSTLTDSGDINFFDSLNTELAGIQARIKDSVYFIIYKNLTGIIEIIYFRPQRSLSWKSA